MSISLIWVGKTKPDYIQKGISEYLKRLQAYTKINTITVREVSLSSCESVEQVKEKEAERLKKYYDTKNVNIALDENGGEMTSLKFSEMIRALQGKNISMFIGGVYGFDSAIASNLTKEIEFLIRSGNRSFAPRLKNFGDADELMTHGSVCRPCPTA